MREAALPTPPAESTQSTTGRLDTPAAGLKLPKLSSAIPIAPLLAAISSLIEFEVRRDVGRHRAGRSANRHDDFTAHVEPGIFVDAEARLDHAVADEHQPGVDRAAPARTRLGSKPTSDWLSKARLARVRESGFAAARHASRGAAEPGRTSRPRSRPASGRGWRIARRHSRQRWRGRANRRRGLRAGRSPGIATWAWMRSAAACSEAAVLARSGCDERECAGEAGRGASLAAGLQLPFPLERVRDDHVDIGKARLPFQRLDQRPVGRHQQRRIARSPRPSTRAAPAPPGPVERIEHLEHRQPAAVAAVENQIVLRPLDQPFERGDMRGRQGR